MDLEVEYEGTKYRVTPEARIFNGNTEVTKLLGERAYNKILRSASEQADELRAKKR